MSDVTRVDFGPPTSSSPTAPPRIGDLGLAIGAPAPSPELAGNASRASIIAHDAGMRLVVSDTGSQVVSNEAMSINMAHVSNGETGILATATRDGLPRAPGDLRPTDRVTINGLDTELRVAERLGLVTRDKTSGLYSNAPEANIKEATGEAQAEREAAREVVKAQEAAAAKEAAKLPSVTSEAAIEEITAKVTPGTLTRGLLDAVANGGAINSRVLTLAASEAAMHPSEMASKVSAAYKGFEAQADSHLASRGVDIEAFGNWARANHRESDLKRAMAAHVQNRDTGAYNALADTYLSTLDVHSPDLILNATFPDPGVSAYKSTDGHIVLRTPHGEMSWSAAVKAGIVAPFVSRRSA